MPDYDFSTLNDKEFEILCVDILSRLENVRFERFKAGKDAGVDGRYFKSNQSEVILQCKHWPNTPIEQLISYLKAKEQPKVARLNPARYILAVSHTLSRTDKSAIAAALSPYIQSPSDIFGREDLNDQIGINKEIEKRHYKLWLCSANVLSIMLNKAVLDRSRFTLEEIRESVRKYVATVNHNLALEKLETLGVLVISGEPGIGKSTLADHLCLHYVANEFNFVKMNGIRDAEDVFDKEEKQIFYYDDFLGRNYLEAISGVQGGQVADFMRRIAKTKNKRFILTSRSTILNQGKLLIDKLNHQNIERNEFELTIKSLSDLDKAKILYSHIWHCELSKDFIDELYKEKRYKDVIKHRNYNPRLIHFITDSNRAGGIAASEYWPYIQSKLVNPAEVWDNPFVVQQDDFGRAIVLLVTVNRTPIREADLADAYSRFIWRPENSGLKGQRDFIANLRHLSGSLISRTVDAKGFASLDLFNPSIGDYVLQRYTSDLNAFRLGFLSLRTLESLQSLLGLAKSNRLSSTYVVAILTDVLKEASKAQFVGYSSSYIAKAAIELVDADGARIDSDSVKAAVKFVTSEQVPTYFEDVSRVFLEGLKSLNLPNQIAVKFVLDACEIGANQSELEILGDVIFQLDPRTEGYEDAKTALRAQVVAYWSDNLSSEISEKDLFSDFSPEDYEYAEKKLESHLDSKLSAIGLDFDANDIQEILAHVDIQSELDEHCRLPEDRGAYSYSYRSSAFSLPVDEIDDLFERNE